MSGASETPTLTPRKVMAAFVCAGVALALVNAIYTEVAVPLTSVGLRLVHHATDAVEHLALGIVAGAVMAALVAFRPKVAFAVAALASAPVLHVAMGHSIWRRVMLTFDGKVEWSVYWPLVALGAAALPGVFLLGHWLGKFRRVFWIVPVASVATLGINTAIQTDQYYGDHGVVACGAALFLGAALARRYEARLPTWDLRYATRVIGIRVVAPIVFFALWPPSNSVRIELFKPPCAVAAWTLTTTLWRAPAVNAVAPVTPWIAGRSGDAPIPPTTPPIVQGPPVVVLITIDATRADVVNSDKPPERLDELGAMKANGIWFSDANSPGSQTAISLSTMFSGRYFSQLRWEKFGRGARRFSYPAEDPSPRFPELLTAAGVATTVVGGANFLESSFGVARGFREQRMLVAGTEHAMGNDVIGVLIERLRAADGNAPAFFFAHLLEPHHPYDRGAKKTGPDFQRYLSEIALVDSLVARAARVLEERFGPRGVLIVTSDHGEAFGEHGTVQHSKTVYEECLRIPLLFRVRNLAPRRVDTRVGLIDLGPTILDMFGVPTPPGFMGQTLVPLLQGRDVQLTRPLFAEARLKRAILGDVTVIEDVRRETVEVYDLKQDPRELDNRFGRDDRADVPLATMREFFKDAPQLYRP